MASSENARQTGLLFPESNDILVRNEGAAAIRYSSGDLPLKLDWRGLVRGMKPPYNQDTCGACYAYAVLDCIEICAAIMRGGASSATSLAAEQQLVCHADGGMTRACGGGWVAESYTYAMNGIVQLDYWRELRTNSSSCPITNITAELDHLQLKTKNARALRIEAWETAAATEMSVLQALANQPVVALVNTNRQWYDYTGGVFPGNCSDLAEDANHAVVIVGYTEDTFILRNVWGTEWGDNGYMHLPRVGATNDLGRLNKCGILNYATYPVFRPVSPERRGELLRQGFCKGTGTVENDRSKTAVTLRILAANQSTFTVDDLIRVNPHITPDPDAPLEPLTQYFIPPCTRNVPKPPVPSKECGTRYKVLVNANNGLITNGYRHGAPGRRLQEEDAWRRHLLLAAAPDTLDTSSETTTTLAADAQILSTVITAGLRTAASDVSPAGGVGGGLQAHGPQDAAAFIQDSIAAAMGATPAGGRRSMLIYERIDGGADDDVTPRRNLLSSSSGAYDEPECSSVPGYIALPKVDHDGDDITYVPGGSVTDFAAECDALPECKAFNQGGWIKRKSGPTNPGNDCLYVKIQDTQDVSGAVDNVLIQSAASGLCLVAEPRKDGKVSMAPCDTAAPDQRFTSTLHRSAQLGASYLTLCVQSHAFPRGLDGDLNTQLVCLFLTWAVRADYAEATLISTLSALADWQRSRNVPKEGHISRHPEVHKTLRQALRERAEAGGQPSGGGKRPLPLSWLRLLVAWLRRAAAGGPPAAAVCEQDAAAFILAFFGMLRRSDLVRLNCGDALAPRTGGIILMVRRSKTDQLGAGAQVCLAELTRSGVAIGRLVRAHLDRRREAGAALDAPLFITEGRRWSRPVVTSRLRHWLGEVASAHPEVPLALDTVASHSLRKGGATAAAEAGWSVEQIKAHGRWKSDAVKRYIQPSVERRMALTEIL